MPIGEDAFDYRLTSHAATFVIPFSEEIHNFVLAADSETTFTVPANVNVVLFSATGDFWVRTTGTAAAPSADVTDGDGSELNPVGRRVRAGDTISIASGGEAVSGSMSFYQAME